MRAGNSSLVLPKKKKWVGRRKKIAPPRRACASVAPFDCWMDLHPSLVEMPTARQTTPAWPGVGLRPRPHHVTCGETRADTSNAKPKKAPPKRCAIGTRSPAAERACMGARQRTKAGTTRLARSTGRGGRHRSRHWVPGHDAKDQKPSNRYQK